MAHQMPPSVNCSLDDIDLTALKVSMIRECLWQFLIARGSCIALFLNTCPGLSGFCM